MALFVGVQSGDAIKYRLLSTEVVVIEDTAPHTEPVAFVRKAVQEDYEYFVR